MLLDSVNDFDADRLPADTEVELENTSIPQGHSKNKPGRIPYYKKYPKLVNVVTDFLKTSRSGFKAQYRKRTEVGVALGMGGSLQQLKEHVE